MRLVGATDGFIRAPSSWRGSLAGLLGGRLAAVLTYAAFHVVSATFLRSPGSPPPGRSSASPPAPPTASSPAPWPSPAPAGGLMRRAPAPGRRRSRAPAASPRCCPWPRPRPAEASTAQEIRRASSRLEEIRRERAELREELERIRSRVHDLSSELSNLRAAGGHLGQRCWRSWSTSSRSGSEQIDQTRATSLPPRTACRATRDPQPAPARHLQARPAHTARGAAHGRQLLGPAQPLPVPLPGGPPRPRAGAARWARWSTSSPAASARCERSLAELQRVRRTSAARSTRARAPAARERQQALGRGAGRASRPPRAAWSSSRATRSGSATWWRRWSASAARRSARAAARPSAPARPRARRPPSRPRSPPRPRQRWAGRWREACSTASAATTQPNGTVLRWNGDRDRRGGRDAACARWRRGTVVMAGPFEGYGPTVILSHGGGYYSLYLYLKDVAVKEGDRGRQGAGAGTVGGERTPEGAHLEFQIRAPGGEAVDPLAWLRSRRGRVSLPALRGHAEARAPSGPRAPRRPLPQSLLLHGPAGIGKERLGLWLAQLLVCEAPGAEGGPCGACQPCRLVDAAGAPRRPLVLPPSPPRRRRRRAAAREAGGGSAAPELQRAPREPPAASPPTSGRPPTSSPPSRPCSSLADGAPRHRRAARSSWWATRS